MHPNILNRITRVADRLRSQSLAACLLLFWVIVLLLALQGFLPTLRFPRQASGEFDFSSPTTLLCGLLILGPLALYVITRFAYRNPRDIAQRIESKYPDLKQRLFTLMSPAREGESEFMRNRLILSTLEHSDRHPWTELAPSSRYRWMWFGQSVLALCTISYLLFTPSSIPQKESIAQVTENGSFTVEPGNIELEAGSDLLVTVRFGNGVSQQATLIARDETGEIESFPMQGSLNDALASSTIRKLKSPIEYQVVVGDQTSDTFQVKLFEHPAIIASDASIKYPSYARLEDKEIKNTRRVTAVDGSTVSWELAINKPVKIAELVDEQGSVLPLSIDHSDPTKYRIPLTLNESQRYQIRLVDTQDRTSKIKEELSIRILPNQEPKLQLTSPLDQRVSAIQELAVSAKAQDDFGILRTGISVAIGDRQPEEIVISEAPFSTPVTTPVNQTATAPNDATTNTHQPQTVKKQEVKYLIDLESLEAKTDQLVTYHFWTEDQSRSGEIRRVDSDLFFAEIRPFEELFRESDASATEQRQQQQQQQQNSPAGQQAEELSELQKKIMTAAWNILRSWPTDKTTESLTPEFKEKIEVIKTSQEQAFEQSKAIEQQLIEQQLQDAKSLSELTGVQQAMQAAIEKLQVAPTPKDSIVIRESMTEMRKAYEGLLRLRAREHEIVQSQQQQSSSSQSQSASQRNRQQQIEQLQLEQSPSRYEEESQPVPEEAPVDKEMRQVMNRLDELAKRQADLNEQIRELDVQLQLEKEESKRTELEEQLQRLREEQEEMIRDTDEVLERMNNSDMNATESQQNMEEARKQVEQAREQMQQAQEQLDNQQTSSALNSATRAQQSVDQTRQQLREQSSQALEQQVSNLVQQAQAIEKRQSELEQLLKNQTAEESPKTDTPSAPRESMLRSEAELLQQASPENNPSEGWKSQKEDLQQLLEGLKETVEQAESSEPLLAEQLYDTYRDSVQENTEQRLERIPTLIERGLDQPALEDAKAVSDQLQKLRQRIEDASQSVLGNETESLRRAMRELQDAQSEVDSELQRQSGQSTENSNSANPDTANTSSAKTNPESANPDNSNPQEPNKSDQEGRNNQEGGKNRKGGSNQEGQKNDEGPNPDNPNPDNPNPDGQNPVVPKNDQATEGNSEGERAGAPSPRDSQRRGSSDAEQSILEQIEAEQSAGNQPEGRRAGQARGEGGVQAAPITGEDYAQWSDRLREAEELIRDPNWKAEAARIREAARDFRVEYLRHSKEPQWDLVKKLVSDPLKDLQKKVKEELLRKSAKQNEIVPLDRDPVPERFQSKLDRYFEELGTGERK